MPRIQATPDEIAKHPAMLEDTPRRIAAVTANMTEAQLHASPDGKE